MSSKKPSDHYIALGVTAFCVIGASILFFFLLYHFTGVWALVEKLMLILRPILYGLVLAFLLLPVQRHILAFLTSFAPSPKVRPILNGTAILLSLIFALLVIYILLAMVLPQLYFSVVGLVQAFPDYIETVQNWLVKTWEDNPALREFLLPYYESTTQALEDWLENDIMPNLESMSTVLNWAKEFLLPNVTDVVTSVSVVVATSLMVLKDILIGLIVSVYLLARKDTFAAQSKKIIYSLLPTRYGDLVVEEVRSAYRIMSGFINGKLVDSAIIGVICLICCNILRFPYPALVATIIGVTNIVPFFGPFIGAIPCFFLILLVNPLQAVYFALFVLVLQQFDGNILGPKILGDSTGLASFWVLFSILLFGGLFGFAGMVLGVPVFAMLYSILSRLVARGLRQRGLPVETAQYMGKTEAFSAYMPEKKE